MNAVSGFLVRNVLVLFIVLFFSLHGENAFPGTNECNARVVVEKSERSEQSNVNWIFTFRVKTDCSNSTGRFQYNYVVVPGPTKPTTRTVANWTAANGKTFLWTDEVRVEPDQLLQFTEVLTNTIDSARIR